MVKKQTTNQEWLNIAIEAITDGRSYTVYQLKKEDVKRCHLGCYVCNKKNEALLEVVMEGGEPFWFGTSCAKLFKKATGIDLKELVKKD